MGGESAGIVAGDKDPSQSGGTRGSPTRTRLATTATRSTFAVAPIVRLVGPSPGRAGASALASGVAA